MHSQCMLLGGRCGTKDDAKDDGTPHIAAVCPEARPSPQSSRVASHCPPTSPLLPIIKTEWKRHNQGDESAPDAEHLFIGYGISKGVSYPHSTAQETNYLLRRMLSVFMAIGFRPAVHITLDWVHIHGAPAVSS